MEEYGIVWTEPAVESLESAVGYLEQKNPAAAEKMRRSVLEHVEVLKSFPFIGPVYPKDRHGLTREIVSGKYRVFYRVIEEDKRVEILAIWHGARQDPDESE